jgi:hypothetical protein
VKGDLLKEFLVGLGFKVDAPGLKKFLDGVEGATKVAVKAGAAATGMAVAIEAAVVRVSKQFEDLYYASQRIHSSVENIRATDYAISQMGGSADGARAAMEGIANLIRSNPGGENFIRSLGVETRGANGELRDTAEIVSDLGARFRAMPYYMAKVRAGILGIDDRTLQAMIRGTDQFSDRYHAMAARVGVDQQAAAKASHDFMVEVRDLKTELELLFDKMLLGLQGATGPAMQRLGATFETVFAAVIRIASVVLGWLGQLDHATGGWSTTLIVVAGVLAPLIALIGGAAAGVLALAAGIVALIDDFQTWKSGGKSLIDWSAWSAEIGHVLTALGPLFDALRELGGELAQIGAAIAKWLGPYVGNVVRATLEGITGGLHVLTEMIRLVSALLRGDWAAAWRIAKDGAVQYGRDVKAMWDKLMGKREAPEIPRPKGQPGQAQQPGTPGPAAQITAGALGLGKQIADFFKAKGFSDQQAQGMAAGAFAESQLRSDNVNPKSGAYGIGQWLGPRKAELFRRYGPNPGMLQQLEFMAWELAHSEAVAASAIKAQQTARGALDAYVKAFMRPRAGMETAGDLARGAAYLSAQTARPVLATSNPAPANVSIDQKTDIHVHGASDPSAAARETARQQARVNGDLVRNTKSAVI